MNALYRETSPGLIGCSTFKPKVPVDLQQSIDVIFERSARLEDLIFAIRESAREMQQNKDWGAHIDLIDGDRLERDAENLDVAIHALENVNPSAPQVAS